MPYHFRSTAYDKKAPAEAEAEIIFFIILREEKRYQLKLIRSELSLSTS